MWRDLDEKEIQFSNFLDLLISNFSLRRIAYLQYEGGWEDYYLVADAEPADYRVDFTVYKEGEKIANVVVEADTGKAEVEYYNLNSQEIRDLERFTELIKDYLKQVGFTLNQTAFKFESKDEDLLWLEKESEVKNEKNQVIKIKL